MEAARANRRSPRGHLDRRLPLGGSLSRPSLPRRCHPMAPDSAIRWSSFHRSCPSCLRLVTLLERNGRYTQRLVEESPRGVAVKRCYWNYNAIPNKKKKKRLQCGLDCWMFEPLEGHCSIVLSFVSFYSFKLN